MASPTRRLIGRAALTVTLLGAALGALALLNLRDTVHDSTGAICGSVWHWHNSSQTSKGGEMSDAERAAGDAECHAAALGRYQRGMALTWPALAALTVGGAGLAATRSTRSHQFA